MLMSKQYLQGYENLLEIVKQKTDRYETLKCEYETIGFNSSNGEHVQTSLNPDRFTNLLIKVTEAEKDLKKAKLDLIHFEQTARNRINELSNDLHKKVLILKYLKLFSFNKIANKLNVSVRYVHVIHKQALIQFDNLFFNL